MAKSLIAFCLVLIVASQSFAQDTPSATSRTFSGPRKQLATIVFCGLGGAIVGLSTLSFYGRPQDKLSNISIGAAVGVIAGTAYVTYRAARNPGQLYGVIPQSEREFEMNRMQASNEARGPLQMTLEF